MDSTKVELISKPLDKLVKKLVEESADKHSIWDTLTPLLIGAGLTLLTQLFIELYKSTKDVKKKKQELISRGRAKMYLIAQILKDLSMYKVHKQYYLRAFEIGTDQADKEDNYKKHYEKGQEQRIIESKLDDNIAEYFQLVTEFIILTNKKDHFKDHFNGIFNYDHPKSSKFKDFNTETELVAGLEIEENRLNGEYQKFRDIFETVQTEMEKED